jgi:xanthine/uracil/vitamin C permease (AzgA family)
VSVPEMMPVNAGLAALFLGGLILLAVAVWWSWVGDGIAVPRERWPGPVRLAALAGWALFIGGIALQLVGYFVHVGVARFPAGFPGVGH